MSARRRLVTAVVAAGASACAPAVIGERWSDDCLGEIEIAEDLVWTDGGATPECHFDYVRGRREFRLDTVAARLQPFAATAVERAGIAIATDRAADFDVDAGGSVRWDGSSLELEDVIHADIEDWPTIDTLSLRYAFAGPTSSFPRFVEGASAALVEVEIDTGTEQDVRRFDVDLPDAGRITAAISGTTAFDLVLAPGVDQVEVSTAVDGVVVVSDVPGRLFDTLTLATRGDARLFLPRDRSYRFVLDGGQVFRSGKVDVDDQSEHVVTIDADGHDIYIGAVDDGVRYPP